MRDVLFFTVAVLVLIFVLYDGYLSLPEALSMVILYAAYVVIVIVGNWWSRRRRAQQTNRALGFSRSPAVDPNATVGSSSSLDPPGISLPPPISSSSDMPFSTSVSGRRRSQSQSHSRRRSMTHSPLHRPQGSRGPSYAVYQQSPLPEIHYTLDTPRANFSLLGAIEFRDVVNSLRREGSVTPSLSPIHTPRGVDGPGDYFSPVPGASHRRAVSLSPATNLSRGQVATSVTTGAQTSAWPEETDSVPSSPSLQRPQDDTGHIAVTEPNPWSDQPGRLTSPSNDLSDTLAKPNLPKLSIPLQAHAQAGMPDAPIPGISITDPSGHPELALSPSNYERIPRRRESQFRIRRRIRMVLRILFPSLQSFRHKSVVGMILAITSVPAIFALTITLPVVDNGRGDEGGIALPSDASDPLNDGQEPLDPESEGEDGYLDDVEEDDRRMSDDIGESLHHLVDERFSPLHSPLGRLYHRRSHSRLRSPLRHPIDEENEGELVFGDDEDGKEELLEEEEEDEALEFHKTLTAVQCVLGPGLCCLVMFRKLLSSGVNLMIAADT
jgi:sodium/potassium/calcium exchanger 6